MCMRRSCCTNNQFCITTYSSYMYIQSCLLLINFNKFNASVLVIETTQPTYVYMYMCRGFESHLRQLIFLWKSDCLGCAVRVALPCLFV